VSWWREADTAARRALAAGMVGWMLDAFDVMLFALVLPNLSAELHLTNGESGLLGSAMLIAAAAGGVASGRLADRFGRTRILMLSIAIYSVFTFLCGFAATLVQFVLLRVFLGFGMGGVWSSGAALVSESWPASSRGRALGFMQSGWAIGYALAVLVAGVVQPRYGWRAPAGALRPLDPAQRQGT
jgi:MFS family permease